VDNTLTDNEIPLLFPNPNQGHFTMQLPKECMGKTYQITDMTGKAIFGGIVSGTETNVSYDLNPGLYFIQIEGQKQSQYMKLVVQ
jgi:hypothetical protein